MGTEIAKIWLSAGSLSLQDGGGAAGACPAPEPERTAIYLYVLREITDMVWRTLRAQRPGRRSAPRAFAPACEVLEDRTVPSTTSLAANLQTAQADRTQLSGLIKQLNGSPQYAQVLGPQLMQVAQSDAPVEQSIIQQATQLEAQLQSSLTAQLNRLQQQENSQLAPLRAEVQALDTLLSLDHGRRYGPLDQFWQSALGSVQRQEAAITAAFNAQIAAANQSYQQSLKVYQADVAQAQAAYNQDQAAIQTASQISARAQTGAATNPADPTLLTLTLNPLDINLLGLEIKTSQITVTVSAQPGNGELLGNLLTDVANLLNLQSVNAALNNVLGSVVTLLNSASLSVNGLTATPVASTTTPLLDAYIAPVHLNLLGALVDTSPIHLTITAHSGSGLLLGNIVADLANLLNSPTGNVLKDIENGLANLLRQLNTMFPTIPSAPVTTTAPTPGTTQVLSLTVPPIDLNLLGLILKTTQIQVNVNAQSGNGQLLGNLLNDLLTSLHATPQDISTLNADLNALLAKLIGVLNAATLTLPANALSSLSQVLQTLALPNLINTSGQSATTPILNLAIASTDGTTPPVDVDLLGLLVTTSNIQVQLLAQTGNGEVLGNLLYNVANLLNPGGSASLLGILNDLGV
jgi:hypothetical protein